MQLLQLISQTLQQQHVLELHQQLAHLGVRNRIVKNGMPMGGVYGIQALLVMPSIMNMGWGHVQLHQAVVFQLLHAQGQVTNLRVRHRMMLTEDHVRGVLLVIVHH